MVEIRKVSEDAYEYLRGIDVQTWAQYASPVPHFHVATSNAVESLNALLVGARRQGPVMALFTLRDWMFGKFGSRRTVANEAIRRGEAFPKNVLDHLREESNKGRRYSRKCVGDRASVRTVGNQTYAVTTRLPVQEDPCSCRLWSATGLPCSHLLAALAAHDPQLGWTPWVSVYWSWNEQAALYSADFPAVDTVNLEQDANLKVTAFQPTGSRRKKRLPSRGETPLLAQKRRPERTLAGEIIGAAERREQYAAHLLSEQGVVSFVGSSQFIVSGATHHSVDIEKRQCNCTTCKTGAVCAHIIAAEQAPQAVPGSIESDIVPTNELLRPH
jgi:hypothetical protein